MGRARLAWAKYILPRCRLEIASKGVNEEALDEAAADDHIALPGAGLV